MQEKEVITQPRTDTATLIKSCQLIWLHLQSDDEVASTALRDIADRLEEQEATIRHLRLEICNASAILMTHLQTIKTIQAEVDLLNSRPKRYPLDKACQLARIRRTLFSTWSRRCCFNAFENL